MNEQDNNSEIQSSQNKVFIYWYYILSIIIIYSNICRISRPDLSWKVGDIPNQECPCILFSVIPWFQRFVWQSLKALERHVKLFRTKREYAPLFFFLLSTYRKLFDVVCVRYLSIALVLPAVSSNQPGDSTAGRTGAGANQCTAVDRNIFKGKPFNPPEKVSLNAHLIPIFFCFILLKHPFHVELHFFSKHWTFVFLHTSVPILNSL